MMTQKLKIEEMKFICDTVVDSVEIWVEINGAKTPITDWDYELEESRIVLKIS